MAPYLLLSAQKEKKASFPQLLPAISKRQIRWGMMGRHHSVLPCAVARFFSYSVPSLHTQEREAEQGHTSCHLFLSYGSTRGFPPFHAHTEVREKGKSLQRAVIYFASHLFSLSLGTSSQKKTKDFPGLTFFSEVTLSL